jgi:4'-phosphopantetheinyl transferase
VIPRLHAGSCQLWWASASAAGPHLLDLLDEEERHRHDGFLRAEDRGLFLVSHALTRIVTAHHVAIAPRAVRYVSKVATYEKPRFGDAAAELEFSISHSGACIVVAISRAVTLGVDVERVAATGPDAALLASVLCGAEQEAFMAMPSPSRPWAFCRYWTRKEAVLKATGDGLEISPARIAVTAPRTAAALVRWSGPGRPASSVHLYDLDAPPGYAASLATLAEQLECTDHDGSALLQAAA